MHSTSLLESAAALAAVLLLVVGFGRLAGRLRPFLASVHAGTGMRLSIRASLAIDPKRRLVIMVCDGREGLLLLGPDGDLMLGWLDGIAGPKP